MSFTGIPTEQTTAVTDLLVAAIAVACAVSLRRFRSLDSFKVGTWTWTLLLVALAAVLGAAAHGFVMPPQVSYAIWQPLNLSLGLAVAFFCVGAVYDAWGYDISRWTLPPLIAIGIIFYLATTVMQQGFFVFVVYQTIAMSAAFLIYFWLAIGRRLPGAVFMMTAILVNVIAASIQASRSVGFQLVWQFDHNGVFHLVQIIGILLLYVGLCSSLKTIDNFQLDEEQAIRPATQLPASNW